MGGKWNERPGSNFAKRFNREGGLKVGISETVGVAVGALTVIGIIFSLGVNWGKITAITDRLNAHSIRIKETEERLRLVEQAFSTMIELKELIKELIKSHVN